MFSASEIGPYRLVERDGMIVGDDENLPDRRVLLLGQDEASDRSSTCTK